MISLHIKGGLVEAIIAATKHDVALTAIQCRWRAGIAECFASAEPRCEPNVRAWYHDDAEIIDGYGYPVGTLLHFSQDDLVLNPK